MENPIENKGNPKGLLNKGKRIIKETTGRFEKKKKSKLVKKESKD